MVKLPPEYYEAVKKMFGIEIGDKLTFYWTSSGNQYKGTVILCKININTIVGILQEEKEGFAIGRKISVPLRREKFNFWKKEGNDVTVKEVPIKKKREVNVHNKIKALEKKAEELHTKSMKLVENIPAGQPVMSVRHRNTLDRAWSLQREANNLMKEAVELRGTINELF